MELLKAELIRLADMELKDAKEKYGLNHSDHESYAVLLEEVEEAREEMINVEYFLKELWGRIRSNASPEENGKDFADIYNASINLAAEAVQCAAMAYKGLMSNARNNESEDGNVASENKEEAYPQFKSEQYICEALRNMECYEVAYYATTIGALDKDDVIHKIILRQRELWAKNKRERRSS